ncbi:MAG TPA: WG repeat-containing protein [Pyrinomonadaceae bacterium]|nr:WG repeat-containing protein [Pyrinomonadaceae bacterium]
MAIAAVVVVVVAAAGYWWLHLPPGKQKADTSGLYSINVNGKYGFMDRAGKTVITPQFEAVSKFSEGLASVKVGTKFGYINPKGEFVINPQFDAVFPFSEGLAAVQVGTKFGYIDTKGLVTITPQFVYVNSFHNGRAAVKLNGELRSFDQQGKVGHIGKDRYAFIDKDGKFIGTPGFLFVQWGFGSESGWTDDVTLVRTADDQIGILNGSGKVLIADKVDEIGWDDFTDGLAPAATGGRWGYISPKGEWVIAPQFESVHGFVDGLAPVESGQRWGLIDRSGKFVVNPQYDHIFGVSDGYAIFESGKGSIPGCPKYCANYGFISTKGQVVVDAKFVQHPNPDGSYSSPVRAFSEGLAAVKTDDGWGFIDPTGKMVINPQFDEVGSFQDGLTFVKVLGKEAYITKTGAFVIDPFPGTTVAAERSRIAAEAVTTNRARVEQGIVGEWVGTFGRRSNARLTISLQGGVIDAVLLNGGWREVLSGGLRPDNRWLLTGTSVTGAGSSDPGPYNLDTIELDLSADGKSLTGKFRDTQGNTGAVTMKKSG